MSFSDETTHGFARSLGALQARVWDLEAGAPAHETVASDGAIVRQLRAELEEAQKGETKALLLLAQIKREAVDREVDVANLRARLAQRTAKFSVLNAGPKAVNADLEAQRHAKDAQIATLQRRLSEAQRQIVELEKLAPTPVSANEIEGERRMRERAQRELEQANARIRELEEQPAAVPATAPAVDCQVCRAIKLMVLGVEPRPASASPAAIDAPIAEAPRVVNQTSPGAIPGIAKAIRIALASAERPLTCAEIGERAGLPTYKVQTNIGHLRMRGQVVRTGFPGIGIFRDPDAGYRYWLATRPQPASSTEDRTC